MANKQQFSDFGKCVINAEAQAISSLSSRINESFNNACKTMLQCEGRVVVTGMGKSGHIGGKIAATLASTGTPAFFVHPGEASHGDLGMITTKDVVLAISYSGATDELVKILPIIKRLNVPLISLTGNAQSTLATASTIHLDVQVESEACPLGLAPTCSTSATLAMGDALAIALLQSRGFTTEDFALSHPGGNLGRRLLLRVEDIMHQNEAIPFVYDSASISEALIIMTKKCLGMTTIIDQENHLLGVFTDGDLRRVLEKNINFHDTPLKEVMTTHCKTIQPAVMAVEALQIMEQYCITSLPVVADNNTLLGVIHMHALLRAGVL